jgi:cold-inducible RNA-binding protein
MKIFVGNLPFTITKDEVRSLFEPFGRVVSVSIVMKNKMKSRGFGFVHMPEENEALASITGLNGKEYMERALKVSMIRSQTEDEQPYAPGDQPQKSYRYKPKFTPRSGYKNNKKQFSSFQPHREEGREERPWRKSSDRPKFGRSPSRGPSKPWRRSEEPRRTFNQSAGTTGSRSERPWDKKKSYEGNSSDRPSRPWEKKKSYGGNSYAGSAKPWEKKKSFGGNSYGGSKPWDKKKSYDGNTSERSSKPWQKEDSTKSWKSFSDAKPWKKNNDRKFGAPTKPWQKDEAKPWKSSSSSDRKPWSKKDGERKFSGAASAKPWQKNTSSSTYKRKTY